MNQVRKSEFAAMLKSANNETRQLVFENEAWYEKLTIGEVAFCHKLVTLRKLSLERLNKKAFEDNPTVEPIRLRAQGNGPVVALVFNTKFTVFYHLVLNSKAEMAQAKRMVVCYAKSVME